jgi:ABC-type oligopeptide transport system substrate-binding subunit
MKRALQVVFATAILAVCGVVLPPQAARAETVLNRGNGGEPSTLDPHRTDGRIESNIFRDLFEGLVVYGPDGKVIPGVAESWTVSEDGLTYTFQLRPNALWSNGDRLTAEDFVYSFRRAVSRQDGIVPSANLAVIRNAEAVSAGSLPPTELGVSAVDPLTVRIVLHSPAPYFLALLSADNDALPVHRATLEKHGKQWATVGNLVSNGPYMLAEWVPQQHVTLARNPKFHHAADIVIDRVIFHPVQDALEELRRFKYGLLDATYEVPQDQVKWLLLSRPHEFWNKPFLATYYYALNLTAEPFKGNRNLRKALALAVDRDTLVEKVTRAGEMPAYSMVPPVVPNYHRQAASFMALPMDQRVEEARRLFAAAGYSPAQPLKLEILFNASDNNWAVSEAVISMWARAFDKGIKVTPVSVDRAEYLKRRARRDFQVVRAAWIGDYADASVFLNLFQSTATPPRNDPGYRSAKYDELLANAAQNSDAADRVAVLESAERLMIEDYPVIPLYHYATKALVSPRLKGWVFNIRDVHPTRFLSFAGAPPS